MSFDVRAPSALKECQKWFASIITRPLDVHNRMCSLSPTGNPMEKEACQYIAPSLSLKAHQRIELYNQQYWWRLLNVMHDIFPLVVRLFGYTDFNQSLGFPYLVTYYPKHWSLNTIGDKLPCWIKEAYHHADQQFVLDAALVDLSYNQSFLSGSRPALRAQNNHSLSAISSAKLYLQPYVHLFALNYNLFSFRDEMISQEPEYWIDHDFPLLHKGKKYFVLYRSPQWQIIWQEITTAEYCLLHCFKAGATISQACLKLEKQDADIVNPALPHIQEWFELWVAGDWLALQKNSN